MINLIDFKQHVQIMFIVTFEGVKMKIFFMTVFLVSFYAHADEQYVFCANQGDELGMASQ